MSSLVSLVRHLQQTNLQAELFGVSKDGCETFNPFPGTAYRCSPESRIREFQNIVMEGGLIATVRKTRGDDIDAACGQLVGKVLDRTRRSRTIREQQLRA